MKSEIEKAKKTTAAAKIATTNALPRRFIFDCLGGEGKGDSRQAACVALPSV
jgi:hypothetical protein